MITWTTALWVAAPLREDAPVLERVLADAHQRWRESAAEANLVPVEPGPVERWEPMWSVPYGVGPDGEELKAPVGRGMAFEYVDVATVAPDSWTLFLEGKARIGPAPEHFDG